MRVIQPGHKGSKKRGFSRHSKKMPQNCNEMIFFYYLIPKTYHFVVLYSSKNIVLFV